MKTWTATAVTLAHPAAVLDVLTDPDACARWAPVPFDVEDDTRRLAAGSRARVTGRLAGQRVGFDVEVRRADENGLALSATGPISLDVFYEIRDYRPLGDSPSDASAQRESSPGSRVDASVSVRPQRGFLSRLLAEATGALLSAGALDHALARLVREAA